MLYVLALVVLFSFNPSHAMNPRDLDPTIGCGAGAKRFAKMVGKKIEKKAKKLWKKTTRSATRGTGPRGRIAGVRARRTGLSKWKKLKGTLKDVFG